MATEIELNGERYAVGKLSALQQFHVSRRIAPIIPSLIPVLMRFATGYDALVPARGPADAPEAAGAADAAEDAGALRDVLRMVDVVTPVLQPFADALAGLRDEDAEYVFGTCLSVVERRQDHGWSRIWSSAQQTAMFDDLDLGVMLPLVARVVIANLGPFMRGLLTSQTSSPAAI